MLLYQWKARNNALVDHMRVRRPVTAEHRYHVFYAADHNIVGCLDRIGGNMGREYDVVEAEQWMVGLSRGIDKNVDEFECIDSCARKVSCA